jgi:uncharacterized protein YoxC
MLISVSIALLTLTVVVVACVLIPTVLELRRTSVAIREAVTRTSDELLPTLKELRQAVSDLKVVTHGLAGRMEDVELCMEAVGDTGRKIKVINTAIGSVSTLLGTSSAWVTGVRVASSYLVERLRRKKGGYKNV